MTDADRSGPGERIGAPAVGAVARAARRSRARGFRLGAPTVLRLDGRYWCDPLGFSIEVHSANPEEDALLALVTAAQDTDPAGAPESAVAVALAVLQATDAERRTWIVDADPSRASRRTAGSTETYHGCTGIDPSGGGAGRPRPRLTDSHDDEGPDLSPDRIAPVESERPGSTGASKRGRTAAHDVGGSERPAAQVVPGLGRDPAPGPRSILIGDFVRTVEERGLRHHEVADVPTVPSGFAHLDADASVRDGDATLVLVDLRSAIAVLDWSGDLSRVWAASQDAHSVRAALWRLRRRLGDVPPTSADGTGGGLSVSV